jgi:hypothetical protein
MNYIVTGIQSLKGAVLIGIPIYITIIALFFPYGFLLPHIFRSCKGNWKKIVVICALT